jgi:hypothetical protein
MIAWQKKQEEKDKPGHGYGVLVCFFEIKKSGWDAGNELHPLFGAIMLAYL